MLFQDFHWFSLWKIWIVLCFFFCLDLQKANYISMLHLQQPIENSKYHPWRWNRSDTFSSTRRWNRSHDINWLCKAPNSWGSFFSHKDLWPLDPEGFCMWQNHQISNIISMSSPAQLSSTNLCFFLNWFWFILDYVYESPSSFTGY